jgi:hypothetical protein
MIWMVALAVPGRCWDMQGVAKEHIFGDVQRNCKTLSYWYSCGSSL